MLTIYAPLENTKSKCWEIFNGIKQSWPTEVKIKSNLENTAESPAMFWGFVNNNIGEFLKIKYMLDTGEIAHQIDLANLI